jgi:chemotaxis protein histidine kinase CheA
MSALPNEPKPNLIANLTAVPTPPRELIEEQDLVVRQARALVISSVEDYDAAGKFLNEVVVVGKKKVWNFFEPFVRGADALHKMLTKARGENLAPWEEAESLIKSARVSYFAEQKRKQEAEMRERERIAREQEEARKRAEAEAERKRAEEEAARIREDAERRRIEAEAEAERQRNAAAEARTKREREDAERVARELEEKAAEEARRAEEEAAQIQASGEATAAAIAAEPVHLALPTQTGGTKLKGVAETWKCDRTKFDRVAFALWIAEDPKHRAKYIEEPAWKILDAEANQLRSQFDVSGIVVGPKYTGRAGAK